MALSFVSGNPRVNLGAVPELSGTTAFTIAAWVKLGSTAFDLTIAMRGSIFSSNAPFLLWRDDLASVSGRVNTLAALVNTNAGLLRIEAANNLLNDINQWHHVAFVFEANQIDGLRLYLNGNRDAYTTSAVGHTQTISNTAGVTLGINDTSHTYQGEMAEVAFWDTALTDQQITQLAQGFTPLTLRNSLDHLVVYQDLLRPLNRPGIGSTATQTGTFAQAEHPRTIAPCSHPPMASSFPLLLPGPYRQATGQKSHDGPAKGDVFITGTAAGALTPTGEVDS